MGGSSSSSSTSSSSVSRSLAEAEAATAAGAKRTGSSQRHGGDTAAASSNHSDRTSRHAYLTHSLTHLLLPTCLLAYLLILTSVPRHVAWPATLLFGASTTGHSSPPVQAAPSVTAPPFSLPGPSEAMKPDGPSRSGLSGRDAARAKATARPSQYMLMLRVCQVSKYRSQVGQSQRDRYDIAILLNVLHLSCL